MKPENLKWILLASLIMSNLSTYLHAQAKPEKPAGAAGKPGLTNFDDFVDQALKDGKVPSLAIAVVQDGKVILLKGYGYRDLEQQLRVTPNTLFAIGSISKWFTVTTLCMKWTRAKWHLHRVCWWPQFWARPQGRGREGTALVGGRE